MKVQDHIEALPGNRRAEAEELCALFTEVTGWQPKLWRNVIGFGRYTYKTKAGTSGAFFATGFNPGAREISFHILPGYEDYPDIAARFGPHRRGRSCWYVRRLETVDRTALADLIRAGLADLARFSEIHPE